MRNASKLRNQYLKLPIVISAVITFIYYLFAYKWSETGDVSNVRIYIISIAIFLGSYFCFLLFNLYMPRTKDAGISRRKWFFCIAFFLGIVFLYGCYVNEIDKYAFPLNYFRHRIGWMYLVFILLSICICYHLVRLSSFRKNGVRVFFAGAIALLQGWFLYAPNPFLDDMGSITHIDAYTNSIINAIAFTPYEMYSSSIYGHHGLLFIIPVKIMQLLGVSMWNAVAITIALVGFLTFSIIYWGLSQVIENDAIYCIAVLAISVISFQIYKNQYFQMMPHRLVFQAIMLSGCIVAFRNPDSKIIRCIIWIIAAVSMVWNIETGVVVTITWSVADFYLERAKRGLSIRICLRAVGVPIILFLCGFGIVNIYNLLVGGRMIGITTYIYPIGSSTYQIDMLELALMNPMSGYFVVILLFMCTICFYSIKYIVLDLSEKEFIALLSGCLGIGVYTYYMNRAVTLNATIVTFEFVLLLAYYVDCNAKLFYEREALTNLLLAKEEGLISFFCFVIIVGLALASVSTLGSTLDGKLKTTWNMESANEFLYEANSKIPMDSVGFGPCTAQLFAMMNRSTGIYIADWEDMGQSWANTIMNEESFEELEKQLKNNYKHIVVSSSVDEYLTNGKYEKIAEIEYNNFSFYVYELQE